MVSSSRPRHPFSSPLPVPYFHPLHLMSPRQARRSAATDGIICGESLSVNPTEAFETLDLRVGRVLRAEVNARARKPAYKLWIDFGPLGERTSSAQLRARYSVEDLVGRLVIAAVNLGSRNI